MAACSLVFDEEDHSSELDPEARVAFMFIKQDIERDQEAYNLVIERNRRNGQNGGRPRNTQDNQENPENPSEPKKPSGLSENPENPSEPNMNRVEESRGDKSREDKKGINNSLSLSREEEEREREIFLISLLFLRKGIQLPVSEARDYYNYYQASGWCKSNEHQTPIVDRIAYAETWKTKRESIISEDEGNAWANIIEAVNFTNLKMAEEFVNGYRGYLTNGQELRIFFSRRDTGVKLIKTMETNEEFKTRIFKGILAYIGKTLTTVKTDSAANDPRR